jgi:AraC-like DNA-binding protein
MKRFQIEERLREAKRLLGSTDMTVTQIAFELHYASSQKFAAQFRALTGVSPTEYRREYG